MYKLEEVVDAFESWRVSRINSREPIPDELWVMAKALLPSYKKSHIQKALKLSGTQFNGRCLTAQQCCEETTMQDGFVSDVFRLQNTYVDDGCELTVKGKDKSLCIKANIQQLPQILPLMMGYL
jgi:hypothetical protein